MLAKLYFEIGQTTKFYFIQKKFPKNTYPVHCTLLTRVCFPCPCYEESQAAICRDMLLDKLCAPLATGSRILCIREILKVTFIFYQPLYIFRLLLVPLVYRGFFADEIYIYFLRMYLYRDKLPISQKEMYARRMTF